MSRKYVVISGVVIGCIAVDQAVRAYSQLPLHVGSVEVPVWALRVAVVGLVALAIVAIAASAWAQTNMVLNGNMEVVSGNVVSGWRVDKPTDATGGIRSVEMPVKSGKRALLLKGRGLWLSANASPAPISPANSYRASAWIRVKKGHARIQINYWTENKWLGASDGLQRITNDEWQHVSVESDSNKFPDVTHLHIGIVADGPDVEVYVDDVAMTAVKSKR